MTDYYWRQIDKAMQGGVSNLEGEDLCFYYMDRVSGGYDASEANQLIANLKMSVSIEKENPQRWKYKGQAIRQFANDLVMLLSNWEKYSLLIIPVAPSSPRGSELFDDRIMQVANLASSRLSNTWTTEGFAVSDNLGITHHGGQRDWRRFKESLHHDGTDFSEADIIVLIDDVITSGAHYKAYQQAILELSPCALVVGVFWAKQTAGGDIEYTYLNRVE